VKKVTVLSSHIITVIFNQLNIKKKSKKIISEKIKIKKPCRETL
jgi:hypothetical protein